MSVAIPTTPNPADEPLAVTLAELLEVLSEITQDEDEIVATLLHMVEERRVRLVLPPTATAL